MISKITAYKNNYYKQNFGNLNQGIQKPAENPPKETINQLPDDGTIKASILVFNDIHGKMTNMERNYAISKQFDRIAPADADKLKLAAGDIILGANFASNQVASKFLTWAGVTNNALGNHECDVVPEKLAELLKDASYKLLAINANVAPDSPMAGKIQKSTIEEHNGHRYGIIGIAPCDLSSRVKLNDSVKDFQIDDLETTFKKVQEEVTRLKEEEGINKIIILSHNGLKNDKKMAELTDGIDIIHSAHTHELVEGLEKGNNILYSKSGEPIILTEYGKDGEYAGILNVEFNSDGIITKAQNNIIKNRRFNRTLPIRAAVEDIIGKPEIVGIVSKAVEPPKDRLLEYNPHAGVIVDAMRAELDVDIAVLNAGNIRGHFTPGNVDSRLISDITPFEDKMWINHLSEKDLVNAIKFGAASFNNSSHKPGLLFVSGMKYKINDKGELLSLTYVDKNGKEEAIDINNPSSERKFRVASDDFFATGGDDYLPSNKNPDFVLEKFDFDKNKLACDYIKKLPQPFEVINDNRIEIVPS